VDNIEKQRRVSAYDRSDSKKEFMEIIKEWQEDKSGRGTAKTIKEIESSKGKS